MTIKTTTATAPAYWAPYLINADRSGMEDHELDQCDAWTVRVCGAQYRVVDAPGDPYFGCFEGQGVDLLDYTLLSYAE